MATNTNAQVIFRIRRFDPARQDRPTWEDYRLPYWHGMTVLDGLRKLKETQAPSLAWRSSCRMGVCGSCGMFINGHPRLACNTQVTELGTNLVTVAPLPNFNIIRDLVPDLVPMFEKHQNLHPHIIRDDTEEFTNPTFEYWQSPHELEQYLQFSVLHQVRLLHGRVPDGGDRRELLGADAARPGSSLQRRPAGRRVQDPQAGAGHGRRPLEVPLCR